MLLTMSTQSSRLKPCLEMQLVAKFGTLIGLSGGSPVEMAETSNGRSGENSAAPGGSSASAENRIA